MSNNNSVLINEKKPSNVTEDLCSAKIEPMNTVLNQLDILPVDCLSVRYLSGTVCLTPISSSRSQNFSLHTEPLN